MRNIFIYCIFLISISATAQSPSDIFKHHADSLPAERIYLQFDKQAYISGEAMWFKGYIISSYSFHSPSTDFYIDVLNDRDSIVLSKKLPIIDGTVAGNLDLPSNLRQGIYFVRGY